MLDGKILIKLYLISVSFIETNRKDPDRINWKVILSDSVDAGKVFSFYITYLLSGYSSHYRCITIYYILSIERTL